MIDIRFEEIKQIIIPTVNGSELTISVISFHPKKKHQCLQCMTKPISKKNETEKPMDAFCIMFLKWETDHIQN